MSTNTDRPVRCFDPGQIIHRVSSGASVKVVKCVPITGGYSCCHVYYDGPRGITWTLCSSFEGRGDHDRRHG